MADFFQYTRPRVALRWGNRIQAIILISFLYSISCSYRDIGVMDGYNHERDSNLFIISIYVTVNDQTRNCPGVLVTDRVAFASCECIRDQPVKNVKFKFGDLISDVIEPEEGKFYDIDIMAPFCREKMHGDTGVLLVINDKLPSPNGKRTEIDSCPVRIASKESLNLIDYSQCYLIGVESESTQRPEKTTSPSVSRIVRISSLKMTQGRKNFTVKFEEEVFESDIGSPIICPHQNDPRLIGLLREIPKFRLISRISDNNTDDVIPPAVGVLVTEFFKDPYISEQLKRTFRGSKMKECTQSRSPIHPLTFRRKNEYEAADDDWNFEVMRNDDEKTNSARFPLSHSISLLSIWFSTLF